MATGTAVEAEGIARAWIVASGSLYYRRKYRGRGSWLTDRAKASRLPLSSAASIAARVAGGRVESVR